MSVTQESVAPLSVAIAEDSVLLREGLTRILSDAGLDVVAAYDNADALLMRVRSLPPDIVIVDIRLPPTHSDEGMRAALEIRERHPEVAVLVLSQYVELGLAMQLLSESAEKVGLPAQGPDQRRQRLRGCCPSGGQRWIRDRPEDRLDAAAAPAQR